VVHTYTQEGHKLCLSYWTSSFHSDNDTITFKHLASLIHSPYYYLDRIPRGKWQT